ncbi:Cytosolic endo-beta-N-acetylglucosaminidase [Hypsibius exemplaris]|uniref:Cytosolic endo-beta-N-acetylglucosaminidase n=1 Tax=Hypsibius exemplaris TaxID=2072580 RepID=A0A1W0X2V4_HYPEX|nr:Cytosolic endo-beta-N-acetylglucosaminidase [Hypsibius exemplaris]
MGTETLPLKTLDELLKWTPASAYGRPSDVKLEGSNAWTDNRNGPRTLLCHDMRGGYLADRFTDGCNVASDEPYLFYHWSHIHGFIYFSHNFVTIPPTGWINAAHRNNVPVFGTLITEWDDGKAIWDRLLSDADLLKEVALKLVQIADHYGFDGWLINIENSIEPEHIEKVLLFLHWLRQCNTLSSAPTNPQTVIWYDSITIKGDLKWQNSLNDHNMKFFQFVDGIFLNYNWKLHDLVTAKKTAGRFRQYDVFVGVDVFGRGCWGGGGWNTSTALEVIHAHDMSVALFAPGWVLECNDSSAFLANQNTFWDSISSHLSKHKVCRLPVSTNFCVGYGTKEFVNGAGKCVPTERDGQICKDHWYDLNRHGLQPSWTNSSGVGDSRTTMRLNHDDGWNGGGCLELISDDSASWSLFKTDIDLSYSPLTVEITLKIGTPLPEQEITCDLRLHLRRNLCRNVVRLICGKTKETITWQEVDISRVLPYETVSANADESDSGWRTLRFIISNILTGGRVLEEISLHVGKFQKPVSWATTRILLGGFHMNSIRTSDDNQSSVEE